MYAIFQFSILVYNNTCIPLCFLERQVQHMLEIAENPQLIRLAAFDDRKKNNHHNMQTPPQLQQLNIK